jgi:hypothetical protein
LRARAEHANRELLEEANVRSANLELNVSQLQIEREKLKNEARGLNESLELMHLSRDQNVGALTMQLNESSEKVKELEQQFQQIARENEEKLLQLADQNRKQIDTMNAALKRREEQLESVQRAFTEQLRLNASQQEAITALRQMLEAQRKGKVRTRQTQRTLLD